MLAEPDARLWHPPEYDPRSRSAALAAQRQLEMFSASCSAIAAKRPNMPVPMAVDMSRNGSEPEPREPPVGFQGVYTWEGFTDAPKGDPIELVTTRLSAHPSPRCRVASLALGEEPLRS